MLRRKRCVVCRQLSTTWQVICGGPAHCHDGCYSTTGRDNRTKDGEPAWKASSTGELPWAKNRMIKHDNARR